MDGTGKDRRGEALALAAPMLDDALMLVREGRASAADVDVAMRLGAGYPQGPIELLASLTEEEARRFGPLPSAADAGATAATAAEAWPGPVGLVGTGTMAGGIVEALARAGRRVMVLYRSEESYEAMVMRIARSLARSVERGRFDAAESDRTLSRIAMTNDAARLADCALVIEAVKEDLDVKRRTLAFLDAALPADLPFATNTSSFRVADLADAVPGRPLFALHFFNPAQAMKLVELVVPAALPPGFADEAVAFARSIGKTPVLAADRRGFLVNRLLIPFVNDAARAVGAGRSAEEVDLVMTEGLEHPMGPLALADLIGLDVMVLALEAMAETEGDPRIAPAPIFGRLVGEGRLGRKSGRGFHDYGGKA